MVHVLVVEDDVKLNQIVCSSLNNAGYTAHGCLNAQAAFDQLFGGGIDVIVSDIMMPGVDGFELVAHVRSVNKKIPILLMTARDDIAAKQRGFRAGIDDYMVKPIDVDELLLRIEALLRRARIDSTLRIMEELNECIRNSKDKHQHKRSGGKVRCGGQPSRESTLPVPQ